MDGRTDGQTAKFEKVALQIDWEVWTFEKFTYHFAWVYDMVVAGTMCFTIASLRKVRQPGRNHYFLRAA